MNTKKYWNKFYNNFYISLPSDFAIWVILRYFNNINNKKIITLGCGNGRDEKYLAIYTKNITAIDNSKKAIQRAKKNTFGLNNIKFIRNNAVDYKYSNIDAVYMRWFLHSISEKDEKKVIKNTYNGLKRGGYLFIEARYVSGIVSILYSIKNIFNSHYRRPLTHKFIKKIKKYFKIKKIVISKNLSPMHKDNPKLIRLVCIKE